MINEEPKINHFNNLKKHLRVNDKTFNYKDSDILLV